MIKVNNVYYMLAFSYKVLNEKNKRFYEEEIFDSIYDLFAVLLTEGITQQIKKGLLCEYKEITEDLNLVRGKINITDSIKKNTKIHHKLSCTYDVYLVNSTFNQIVKTAILYLLRSKKIQDRERFQKLKKCLFYLEEVDEITSLSSISWSHLSFHKNNISYRLLIEVSRLILNHLYIGANTGKLLFSEYLEDKAMATLYENFLRAFLQRNYKEFEITSEKRMWPYLKDTAIGFEKHIPAMKTDISITDKKRKKKLIVDAKFYQSIFSSFYDKESFHANNMYQIFSYVKTENLQFTGKVSGMLLYAKTKEESIGWNEMEIDGNRFVITDIDLTKNFFVIEEKLHAIMKWFKEECSGYELAKKYNKNMYRNE